MYNSKRRAAPAQVIAQRLTPALSPHVRDLKSLGRRVNWKCAILGHAPLPEEPIRYGEWLIVPIHLDSSPIPPRALERVQAIYSAGLTPRGFVVVHEAPKLLAAPIHQARESRFALSALPGAARSALKTLGGVLVGAGVLLLSVTSAVALAVAAISLAALLLVPASLIASVALVDPILVAVTPDGYWVEIDRW